MASKERLKKLYQVLRFQTGELKMLKASLQNRMNEVRLGKLKLDSIKFEILQAEIRAMNEEASVINRQLSNQIMELLDKKQAICRKELSESEQQFELVRQAVVAQKSKIESLEKATERIATNIAYQFDRQEQTVADERFLSTKQFGTDK